MHRLAALSFVTIVALGLSVCCERPSAEEDTGHRAPDCVYVGTPYDVVDKMLEMAAVKKDDLLVDPGCGDGRIAIGAAKRYGCRAIGYEIDPELAAAARKTAQRRGVAPRVSIEEKDIFTVDYSQASVIAMYLLPDMITRLLPQFEEMKPGSRIVAHDYGILGIQPDKEITVRSLEDNSRHTLFLYTLPLKKDESR